MAEKEDNIIVLKSFDNSIDANIAKTKLDAYGIPCFLTEENIANLYPGQSLFFKIRLHLFAADLDRAAQILNGEIFSVDTESATICPSCNSTNVTRAFPKKVADTLMFLLFGVFMPHKKVNQCLDCGCEF